MPEKSDEQKLRYYFRRLDRAAILRGMEVEGRYWMKCLHFFGLLRR